MSSIKNWIAKAIVEAIAGEYEISSDNGGGQVEVVFTATIDPAKVKINSLKSKVSTKMEKEKLLEEKKDLEAQIEKLQLLKKEVEDAMDKQGTSSWFRWFRRTCNLFIWIINTYFISMFIFHVKSN